MQPRVSAATPLILGSQSPRRRDLLAQLGLPHWVAVAEVDERVLAGEEPGDYLERIAAAKLEAVGGLAAVRERTREAPHALLVADTTVVCQGEILGKPSDADEAFAMLTRLAGRTHEVMTRFALGVAFRGDARLVTAHTELTRVTFRACSPAWLRRYAESGEGLDKAGAYAGQGLGSFLISRLEGSYTNVVGLPVAQVVEALERLGWLEAFPL
ncbi:MAG: septum formation protein Maf [Polyangiaceae bacterium]|nr:septum formation protein Maf [Polyangiaceae bacterium]MCW5790820.1 septum formation protein Maf [Polyangiaceae bacterium]